MLDECCIRRCSCNSSTEKKEVQFQAPTAKELNTAPWNRDFYTSWFDLIKFKNARRFTTFDPRVAAPCKVEGNDGSDRSNTMSAPEAAQSIEVGS
jgi:hypothetical protein